MMGKKRGLIHVDLFLLQHHAILFGEAKTSGRIVRCRTGQRENYSFINYPCFFCSRGYVHPACRTVFSPGVLIDFDVNAT